MNARSDPRRSQYFTLNPLGTYGGHDVTAASTPSNQISHIYPTPRLDQNGTFRHPILTWAENQMILAEALFQIAIVLGSVAIVAASRPLVTLSGVLAVVASLLMINGYFLLVHLPFE